MTIHPYCTYPLGSPIAHEKIIKNRNDPIK
jgi:hypothetical protein